MEWSKEPFDDVLAQQAAMKIIIGSLMIDRLVSERHRDDQIRELCDFRSWSSTTRTVLSKGAMVNLSVQRFIV